MEKITITRISPEKTVEYMNKKTGKPDSFQKVGVLTNEHGEKWFDITFRGECPVQVGQSYDVELTERQYQTKAGETKTAYGAELPRTARTNIGGGMSSEQFQKLYTEVYAARQEVVMIRQLLEAKEIIPSVKPVATGVEYPASTGPSAFNDDPANDPDFDPFGGM